MAINIIDELVDNLTKLPGIGRKTAQRLSFFILSMSDTEAKRLAEAIINLKEKALFCSICFNITDKDPCHICSDNLRDRKTICVVEEPSNIVAIERTKIFKGLYHVLLGALSPSEGITPERLKIKELLSRVTEGEIQEVIIATNPNTKGELTASYLKDVLKAYNIKVSRIAYGLPIGSDIEFADEVTLSKSLEGRRAL
ncbi:MAG: recombination mediator RecR [Thermodesulfovibrionales bacterium]|nr:recombination mediator RecR [Thermodesulfovibrionales bacterium]